MELQDAFLALVGIGFATVGPVRLVRLRRGWSRRTSRVAGTVVDRETQTVGGADAAGMPIDHAVVQYDVDGRSFVAVARYGATWLEVRPGERRDVVYDPRNPADGEVFSELGRQIELLVLAVIPIVGLVVAVTFGARLFG